jgi:hypothetical protein
VGRLELPLPEIGAPLKAHAKHMQARIRAQVPGELRKSVKVKVFKKGERSGIVIEYDDRAENFVYTAMEYPPRGGQEKPVAHR